jgi:hypothetical protein
VAAFLSLRKLYNHLKIFDTDELNDFEALVNYNEQDTSLLRKYFEAFDFSLFDGVLTWIGCDLTLVNQGDRQWREGVESFATGIREEHLACVREIENEVFIFEEPNINDRATRLRKYVEALLHEMLYVFLRHVVCFCEGCTFNFHSVTGRRLPWQNIVLRLE